MQVKRSDRSFGICVMCGPAPSSSSNLLFVAYIVVDDDDDDNSLGVGSRSMSMSVCYSTQLACLAVPFRKQTKEMAPRQVGRSCDHGSWMMSATRPPAHTAREDRVKWLFVTYNCRIRQLYTRAEIDGRDSGDAETRRGGGSDI